MKNLLICHILTGVLALIFFGKISEKVYGQPFGPASNFVEVAIDEAGEYVYLRMRGTQSSPREAVKVLLGDGETDPQFVEIVSVESAEYKAARSHTNRDASSSFGRATRMKDGTRFFYRYDEAIVVKQASDSRDTLGEIRIPNSPGRLRAAGCVLKDDLRGLVYVGTARGPSDPAQVVKIRAGDASEPPTLVDSITLEPGESNIQCGVIDRLNGYAYFGTKQSIVKVGLGESTDPLTRVGAVSLRNHQQDVELAVIDADRRFAYFANKDTIVKTSLGEGATQPRLVGSMTLEKPEPGDFASYLIVPALIPIFLALFLPGRCVGKSWRKLFLLLFVASMAASLVELFVFGVQASYGSFLPVPPVMVSCFFLLVLCQAFLDGIDAVRQSLNERSSTRPWRQFQRVLKPSLILWAVFWTTYLILLEATMLFTQGGGTFFSTTLCMAPVLGMIAACFVWAPRFRTLRGLVLAALASTLALIAMFWGIGFALVGLFGAGGYMGLGYAFLSPMIATALLAVFAIACGVRAVRKGDSWFRNILPGTA